MVLGILKSLHQAAPFLLVLLLFSVFGCCFPSVFSSSSSSLSGGACSDLGRYYSHMEVSAVT